LVAIKIIASRALILGVAAIFLFATASASASTAPVCTQAQAITQAVRTVLVDGNAPVVSTVTLPDTLAAQLLSDAAHLSYALDLGSCAANPLALFIFRAGAPYIVTTADGQQLKSLVEAEHAGAQYNGRVPALFAVPPGTSTVYVVFQTKPHLLLGLLDIAVGPTAAMLPREAQALSAIVGYGRAGAGVLLVFGLLGFYLWLQRRTQASLFWLALGCVLWSVRGNIYFASNLPISARWSELLNPLLVLCTSVCVLLTCLRLVTEPAHKTTRVLAILVAAAFILFLVVGLGGPGMALSIAVCLLVGYIILLGLLWWLWAHRVALQRPRWAALTVSMLAMVAAGGHDALMLYRVGVPSTDAYLLFWGFTVLLFVCVVLSASYLLRSLRQAEGANDQLEQTIVSKTAQLEASYAIVRENERAAARTQAREHLLREMHDGIGAQLITALRGIERGGLEPREVSQSLQDILDELRLLMDSCDNTQPLQTALANWRSRWDARLTATGLSLHWQLADALEDIELPGDTVLQIMRVLQEAGANIVKHAQADEAAVCARIANVLDGVRTFVLEITDNGVGLPSPGEARVGRGIYNMQQRAQIMGATLTLTRRADGLRGTTVRLLLPLP
jgi:signal transduction histidine kinase